MSLASRGDSAKLEVLHLCKVYLPIRGGVQRVVHAMTRLLDKYQHQVLTTGEDGAIQHQVLDQVDITRCRSYLEIASMPIAPSMVLHARRKARRADIACIHYPFPLVDFALFLTFKMPPLIVFWHSNIVAQRRLRWLSYPFILWTLWRSSAIVVTSDKMTKNSTLLSLFRNKIRVIPYGLPALNDDMSRSAVSRINVNSSKDYFLLIGRHVSYKGIDVAINAMAGVDGQLIIAGEGPLYEQHKVLVETLGIESKVTFARYASNEKVIELLKDCIALIVPSVMHNEAFALVQLEAMRLKKPVINTDLPSTVPLIARDQIEGLTVQARDPEQLADAMSKLSSNRDLAARLGENGFDRFSSEFSDTQYGKALNSLFEDMLAAK